MPPPLDFATLFERLPNAFMVLDRELRFVAANPAYLKATGSSLQAILGCYVFDVFPDATNGVVVEASLRHVLLAKQVDELAALEYHVARAPGAVSYTHLTLPTSDLV